MAIGAKTGGRAKGTRNKATIERETKALAELAAGAKAAERRGDTKLAISEMQKALVLAEGFAGKLKPEFTKDADGNIVVKDVGRFRLFGEWFDRWFNIQKELARYQSPQFRAVDAPTPPPDPGSNVKTITLRVFEGGRQIKGPAE